MTARGSGCVACAPASPAVWQDACVRPPGLVVDAPPGLAGNVPASQSLLSSEQEKIMVSRHRRREEAFSQAYQRQPALAVGLPLQVLRRLHEDHLQCGPYMRFQ